MDYSFNSKVMECSENIFIGDMWFYDVLISVKYTRESHRTSKS